MTKHKSPTVLLPQRWGLPMRGVRPHWLRKKRNKRIASKHNSEVKGKEKQ
jgi:hypothetical protein